MTPLERDNDAERELRIRRILEELQRTQQRVERLVQEGPVRLQEGTQGTSRKSDR